MSASPLDIVTVIGDAALAELLHVALHRDLRWRVVADCRRATEVEEVLRREPDCGLLLADPELPDARGADLVERVRALRPGLPILLYTGQVDALTVDVMLRAGVLGMVERGEPLTSLLEAVERVARGEPVFSARVAEVVRGFVVAASGSGGSRLTRREQDIGRRLLRGETVDGIASALGLAPRTVSNVRIRIAAKLGIRMDDRRARPGWLA